MPNSPTKRVALRLSGGQTRITFRTGHDEGTAELTNISTHGCALTGPSTELALDDKILLSFPLGEEDPPIEISAQVVRTGGNQVGIQFLRPDPDKQQRLFRHFLQINRTSQSEQAE